MVQFDHSTTPIAGNPQTGADCNGHKPVWLVPLFDSIPVELKKSRQFLTWKAQKRDSKWTKVPFNARNGNSGSSTNPDTWSSFDEAKAAYTRGGYTGIGVAMADQLAGVDLDNCIDPVTGEISEQAMLIIREFNSYTEISPSGKGVRILFKGKLPGKGLNRDVDGCHIEMYDKGRFLTLTGHHVEGTPETIEPRQEAADNRYQWILDNTEGRKKSTKQSAKQPTAQPAFNPNQKGKDLTDSEVMDCAMNTHNGAKFEKLWDGDIREYPSENHPEGDPSRADSAMVGFLCYHSLDNEQVARLWKASKLYRDKLERQDYIDRTIKFIRDNQTDVCAKAQPGKAPSATNGQPTVKKVTSVLKPELTGREQIIARCFAFWNISDEAFRAYIAIRGIANRRKTFKMGGALLGRHIRIKENGEPETEEQSYQNDKRCGNRRIIGLIKELKAKVNYPLLRVKKKGGKILPSGKRDRALYEINEAIFDLAESYAAKHPAMVLGSPDYNPGKAREEAALFIAKKYKGNDEPEKKPEKPKPDAYGIWVNSERNIWREAQKIAHVWEDLGMTTGQRMDFADRLAAHLKDILLQQISTNLRRKRKRKQQITESEAQKVGTRVSPVNTQSISAAETEERETPVYTGGDTQKGEFANQVGRWRSLGDITPEIPRAAIWRTQDDDRPVTATGIFDDPGSDGRLYVRTLEYSGGLPFEELKFLPSTVADDPRDSPPEQYADPAKVTSSKGPGSFAAITPENLAGNLSSIMEGLIKDQPNAKRQHEGAVKCDHCGKPLSSGALQCSGCGALYTLSYWKANYGIAEGVH